MTSAPKPRRRWRRRALLAVFAVFLLWLGSSAVVTWKLTRRRSSSATEVPPPIANVQVEQLRITTRDHEELGAWLVRGIPDRPTIILLHGIGGSRSDFTPLLPRLASDGYSILAVTQRAHGDSTGAVVDFGYSSRADVVAAVTVAKREFPNRRLIVAGTSLGSASALFAAEELGTRVDGYLLESPYRDLRTATNNRIRMRVPPPLSWAASAGLRLWAPVFLPVGLDKIAPIDGVQKIPASVPIVIITGASDGHATAAEAQAIFERVRSHATLITFQRSGHASLFRDEPELYYATLRELLDGK